MTCERLLGSRRNPHGAESHPFRIYWEMPQEGRSHQSWLGHIPWTSPFSVKVLLWTDCVVSVAAEILGVVLGIPAFVPVSAVLLHQRTTQTTWVKRTHPTRWEGGSLLNSRGPRTFEAVLFFFLLQGFPMNLGANLPLAVGFGRWCISNDHRMWRRGWSTWPNCMVHCDRWNRLNGWMGG